MDASKLIHGTLNCERLNGSEIFLLLTDVLSLPDVAKTPEDMQTEVVLSNGATEACGQI
jgi:hypothetical protein